MREHGEIEEKFHAMIQDRLLLGKVGSRYLFDLPTVNKTLLERILEGDGHE